ncbi:MAG: hypothetical protein ACRERU_19945 [Methylococcales bacterium]
MKEARECFKQNSRNSSRPPSSEASWEKERTSVDSTHENEEAEVAHSDDEKRPGPSKYTDRSSIEAGEKPTDEVRNPGKQLGAEGFGRQQTLAATGREEHYPEFCACCGKSLNADGKPEFEFNQTVGW